MATAVVAEGDEIRSTAAATFAQNRQKRALLIGITCTSELHLPDIRTPDEGRVRGTLRNARPGAVALVLGDHPDHHECCGREHEGPGARADLNGPAAREVALRSKRGANTSPADPQSAQLRVRLRTGLLVPAYGARARGQVVVPGQTVRSPPQESRFRRHDRGRNPRVEAPPATPLTRPESQPGA